MFCRYSTLPSLYLCRSVKIFDSDMVGAMEQETNVNRNEADNWQQKQK